MSVASEWGQVQIANAIRYLGIAVLFHAAVNFLASELRRKP